MSQPKSKKKNLTAARYLEFLRFDLIPALAVLFSNNEDGDISHQRIWFQQDTAPPHYGVGTYVDALTPLNSAALKRSSFFTKEIIINIFTRGKLFEVAFTKSLEVMLEQGQFHFLNGQQRTNELYSDAMLAQLAIYYSYLFHGLDYMHINIIDYNVAFSLPQKSQMKTAATEIDKRRGNHKGDVMLCSLFPSLYVGFYISSNFISIDRIGRLPEKWNINTIFTTMKKIAAEFPKMMSNVEDLQGLGIYKVFFNNENFRDVFAESKMNSCINSLQQHQIDEPDVDEDQDLTKPSDTRPSILDDYN
ncbi:hypothetical protein NQ315_006670 [Exocentrus adspersus]|uniref:Uncharacterized protein n=1 Tax=Exocentrus adspersus TaxID=1586481 RepID=A0AAV8WBM6_9CUCU|nr:hypothetical protein NQ315_006670 [Exocentrus adspersus]